LRGCETFRAGWSRDSALPAAEEGESGYGSDASDGDGRSGLTGGPGDIGEGYFAGKADGDEGGAALFQIVADGGEVREGAGLNGRRLRGGFVLRA